MSKQRKYYWTINIMDWLCLLICVPMFLSVTGIIREQAHISTYYGPTTIPAAFGTVVALFNSIWAPLRHKNHKYGVFSLIVSIVSLILCFLTIIFISFVGAGIFLKPELFVSIPVYFIMLAVALGALSIIKFIFEIKLFIANKNGKIMPNEKEESSSKSVIAEKKTPNTKTVKPHKHNTRVDVSNYTEFDLDHKGYLYLFGAFFIIFEKKCFGWRYIGKSKEGKVTRKGKVNILKYAWFSRAHELKTTKLFKVVEFISNIFIWLSNLLTSLILLVIGIIILLFVLGSTNAAVSVLITYVSMIALNVLLALLGKLLFKVQKIRENNPPAFFDYLDSAVDEEREVMEQMRHEKEKKEFVEEVRKASKADHTSESSESEKLRLLKEYKELLKDGTITKKEFDAKKKELLK